MPVDDVWLKLALVLGLSQKELLDIERKTDNQQECNAAMFLEVKKLNIGDFNVKMLVKALLQVGKFDLADEICIKEGLLSKLMFSCILIVYRK